MAAHLEIKRTITALSDYQLKACISEGESSYENGIFQLYLDEARKRNLKIDNEEIKQVRKEISKSKAYNIVKFGYAFAALGGLAGIIIALVLLLRKKTDETGKRYDFYPKEIRRHGYFILLTFICVIIFLFLLNVFLTLL